MNFINKTHLEHKRSRAVKLEALDDRSHDVFFRWRVQRLIPKITNSDDVSFLRDMNCVISISTYTSSLRG